MEDLNRNRDANAMVDHSLRTYPIASPPPSLMRQVMARIRAESQIPRFRLTWLDYAISAFGASAATLLLFFVQSIPLQTIATSELGSTILVDRLLSGFWNVVATGCWYCAR